MKIEELPHIGKLLAYARTDQDTTSTQIKSLEALRDHGTWMGAGKSIGVTGNAIKCSVEKVFERYKVKGDFSFGNADLHIEQAPNSELDVEEILSYKRKIYDKKKQAHDFNQLIQVQVKDSKPIAVCAIGDPHIDDDGTDIIALERDLDIIRNTKGMYAGHLGDLTNNWVGRLARLYANQSTTANQAIVLMEWMLNYAPNLFVINGNHDCHDIQTQALTKRGWVNGLDIKQDDQVMTMNIQNGKAEWNTINNIITKDYEGDMVSIESQSFSALVTPNHRILHKKREFNNGIYEFSNLSYCKANDLPARFSIPTNGVESLHGCDLTDDQIRFAGWVLTDGSIYNKKPYTKIVIYQSKDGTEIERVLKSCGYEYTVNIRNRNIQQVNGRKLVNQSLPQCEYILNAANARKAFNVISEKNKLPSWAYETTENQFDVLLDALVSGDGTWDGANPNLKNCAVLHGTKEFLEQVQALACIRGWTAMMSIAREKDYRLNLCKRKELQLERCKAVSKKYYNDKVWCLNVNNSNFLVRRNGKVHFSGNCWNQGADLIKFIMRSQSAINASHGARIALNFADGEQIRINARHDFKGHSQYNPTHGSRKEQLWRGDRDHIYIQGHRHHDGASMIPQSNGDISWSFMVSGYKVIDDYADAHGFTPSHANPSVTLVLNPKAKVKADIVKPFWDAEEGADYLTFIRNKI